MTDTTRKRGRPLADPDLGVMSSTERSRWQRKRQIRQQRDVGILLVELWDRQPAEWRIEHEYVHGDTLAVARKWAEAPGE